MRWIPRVPLRTVFTVTVVADLSTCTARVGTPLLALLATLWLIVSAGRIGKCLIESLIKHLIRIERQNFQRILPAFIAECARKPGCKTLVIVDKSFGRS